MKTDKDTFTVLVHKGHPDYSSYFGKELTVREYNGDLYVVALGPKKDCFVRKDLCFIPDPLSVIVKADEEEKELECWQIGCAHGWEEKKHDGYLPQFVYRVKETSVVPYSMEQLLDLFLQDRVFFGPENVISRIERVSIENEKVLIGGYWYDTIEFTEHFTHYPTGAPCGVVEEH